MTPKEERRHGPDPERLGRGGCPERATNHRFICFVGGKSRMQGKLARPKLHLNKMEARAGIEPANRGFAVPGITTLLPRHLAKRRKVLTTESSRKQKPCLVSPNHYKFSISEYRLKIIN